MISKKFMTTNNSQNNKGTRTRLPRQCQQKNSTNVYNDQDPISDLDEFLLNENNSSICECGRNELDDKEKLIFCKVCKKWFHGVCLSLTNIDIENLSSGWFCNKCLNSLDSQHSNIVDMQPCPHCGIEFSNKLYKMPTGLKIHCTRKHPQIVNESINENIEKKNSGTMTIAKIIIDLANYKKNIKILKRIPKGARTLAAHSLSKEIDECVS